MPDCPHCGTPISEQSRFCPECGRSLTEEGALPAYRRRWPPEAFHIVVALVAVGGVILLVGGAWAWGLAVILLAAVLFLSQREAERQAARRAWGNFRARFSATREAVTARSRGQIDLFRARRDRAELEAERTRGFQRLGQAVFYDDKAGTKAARGELDQIGERISEKEAEIDTMLKDIERRVQRAQAGGSPTEKLETVPPEPARVPEPWPPPDEGTPPSPEPDISPPDPAPEPEHPPAPETRRRAKAKSRKT
jgi:predicted nucleic acid-binding Zn ribbon protein